MTKNPLPCLICGKELDHIWGDEDVERYGYLSNQPHDATAFDTNGHYGSTMFDPMNRYEHWELVICKECFTPERLARTRIVLRGIEKGDKGQTLTWDEFNNPKSYPIWKHNERFHLAQAQIAREEGAVADREAGGPQDVPPASPTENRKA